jgi:DNA-binding PadR family transcriptional regulator
MKNRSVTVLALLAANDHFRQPEVHRTMLMKQLFLAEQIRPLYRLWRQTFSFVRYQYGPYSEDVFRRLDMLIFSGLVEVTFMERRQGRVEARYKITPAGHTLLGQIGASEILELSHDLVWSLQTLGVNQTSTICRLVYQEAEFAHLIARHCEEGIGPEAKIPLSAVTAANNETFVILAMLRELLNHQSGENTNFSLPTKEVIRVFLKSLAMQIPHRATNEGAV